MNILHVKYAIEVARLGSLSRAAETLLTAQPNISRSIKELESDLGITIFNRSAKGMELTPEGSEFIRYASEMLKQIDDKLKVAEEQQREANIQMEMKRRREHLERLAQFDKKF